MVRTMGKTGGMRFEGEWRVMTIDELAEVDPENLPNSTPRDYSFNYISIEGVEAGRLVGHTQESFRTAPSRARRVVRVGDVLMSTVRPALRGHLLFDGRPREAVCSTGFAVLRARRSQCDPGFLFAHLFGDGVEAQLQALLVGSNYPAINGTDVRELRVTCPPSLPEQRAIAAVLTDVDDLIGSLEALVAKKRSIKKAAMQELLTGRTRLPGFGGEWETKRLGELGDISGAGVDKKRRPGEVPVRLLNYLDVYHQTFVRSHQLSQVVSASDKQAVRCRIRRGDVFFTPTSEVPDDIGRAALAVEDIVDGVYSYHLVRLRLHVDWDMRFRAFVFDSHAFRDRARICAEGSGTRYVITLPKFRSLQVSYPVSRPEQRAIAAILTDMDAEIAALERRLGKTRAIKQGMMQQLLTGSIRLPIPTDGTGDNDNGA